MERETTHISDDNRRIARNTVMLYCRMLLLLVIAALAALAVRTIRRRKLLSSCGGDCSRCAAGCRHKP